MKRANILICDKDKAYVNALVSYLMERGNSGEMEISVMGITEVADFENFNGRYEVAFMGEPFFQESLLINGLKIKNPILLSEEKSDEENTFYKYQSMDAIEVLVRTRLHVSASMRQGNNRGQMKMVGVYSPGKHELSLPFSLCTCKYFSEKENVLFVDLSEIGVLSYMIGDCIRDVREDLIDVIYMLENGDVGGGLERFIVGYEGFCVLTPVATPSQLAYITPEQWKMLFEKIEESGYRNVVVLFGSMIQGFSELAGKLESLLVLKKNGDYYEIADRAFMDFMGKLELENICKEVILPMSASNLSHGSFRMDALINGKLMSFVTDRIGENVGEFAGSY